MRPSTHRRRSEDLKPKYTTKAAKNTFESGDKFAEFAASKLNPFGITTWTFGSHHQQFAIGENGQGVEYKLDNRCTDTNRLSIEIAEKTDAGNLDWIPSGIMRNDNAWLYVQGNYEIIFVFSKKWLRRVYRKVMRDNPSDVQDWPPSPESTVRRFFLKFKTAHAGAALVIDASTGKRWSGDEV